MIAAWMLYSVMVAAALAVAAFALERALGLYRRPSRYLWAGSMAAGVLLPALVRSGLLQRGDDSTLAGIGVVGALPAALSIPSDAVTRAGTATASLDTLLLLLWGIASAALLAWIAWSAWRLRSDRARWTPTVLEGVPVLVCHDLGPAVVGLLSPVVVLPRWLVEADPSTRRLALEHEMEHVRAGDTRLLLFGLVVAALVPWNVVLWWQLGRLRAAVELDCDRRVLGTTTVPRVYADVLLHVGAHASRIALPGPALTEPGSLLSRRIGAMVSRRVRMRLLRVLAYTAATLGLVVAACDAPGPKAPLEVPEVDQPAVAPEFAGAVPESEVDEPPERISCPALAYPSALREAGVEGSVLLQFVVDRSGNVPPASVEVLRSDHEGFATGAKALIQSCRFHPGRLRGDAVPVIVQMPINFTLARRVTERPRTAGEPPDSIHVTMRALRDYSVRAPEALFIVDGVVVGDRSALDIDTLDIERVEVIKGEAARALYGERGRGGVIRITTKR